MKAYKIELLVMDVDDIGLEEVISTLENQKYPNYCISPLVMDHKSIEVKNWSDDHPLNKMDMVKNGCALSYFK